MWSLPSLISKERLGACVPSLLLIKHSTSNLILLFRILTKPMCIWLLFTSMGKPGLVFIFLLPFFWFLPPHTHTPLLVSYGIMREQRKPPFPLCVSCTLNLHGWCKQLFKLPLWWDANSPVCLNKEPKGTAANPFLRHTFLWLHLIVVQHGSSGVWFCHMPWGRSRKWSEHLLLLLVVSGKEAAYHVSCHPGYSDLSLEVALVSSWDACAVQHPELYHSWSATSENLLIVNIGQS